MISLPSDHYSVSEDMQVQVSVSGKETSLTGTKDRPTFITAISNPLLSTSIHKGRIINSIGTE